MFDRDHMPEISVEAAEIFSNQQQMSTNKLYDLQIITNILNSKCAFVGIGNQLFDNFSDEETKSILQYICVRKRSDQTVLLSLSREHNVCMSNMRCFIVKDGELIKNNV